MSDPAPIVLEVEARGDRLQGRARCDGVTIPFSGTLELVAAIQALLRRPA